MFVYINTASTPLYNIESLQSYNDPPLCLFVPGRPQHGGGGAGN